MCFIKFERLEDEYLQSSQEYLDLKDFIKGHFHLPTPLKVKYKFIN